MKRRPGWLFPCIVGGLLRLAAALSGYGWFAPDDYEFAIQQGGDWLLDPSAPFTAAIRSPLLSRVFWLLLRAGEAMGLRDPAALLQGAYAGLGLWSLLAIPATWYLTRYRLGDDAARQATWLTAAYCLMPRIATRALIEVLAVPPLLWALVALDRAADGGLRRRAALGAAAGIMLGAACLLRFQLGILFVAFGVVLRWRAGPRRGAAPQVVGLLLGGGVAAAVQAGIDWQLGRRPLETIANYLTFNQANASGFSTSPWYVYLGHFLLYSIPPATVLLAKPFWKAAKEHVAVSVSLGWFVAVHACIGHKEDRFMYTVLPLFFVLLGSALSAARHSDPRSRRAYGWFWCINAIALAVAVTSDAQRNLTVPLLHIARRHAPQELAAIGYHALPRYYAGPQTHIRFYPDVATYLQAAGDDTDWVLLRHTEDAAAVTGALPQCTQAGRYPGDFADRLVLALNPHRNGRRAPTALLTCRHAHSRRAS